MELGIAGKTALVTGASRGIGRACAIALAAEGARVAVCARDAAALDELVAELGGEARGHRLFALDLMEETAPGALAEALLADGGTIDLLVHNLGGTLGVRDAAAPVAEWRKVFRFNLEIAIELDARLLPPMVARGDGRVVYLSSLAAFEHQGSIPYSVVKAALTAYVRGVGRTHAASGVVLSAVVPGVVMSPGGHWEQSLQRDPDYVANYVRERLPRGDFGSPEEVAAAVVFLCSRHAAPFAGSIVPLDGGQGRSFFGQ